MCLMVVAHLSVFVCVSVCVCMHMDIGVSACFIYFHVM
jgi:hypothetical protein